MPMTDYLSYKRGVKRSFNKIAIALFAYDFVFMFGALLIFLFGTDLFQNEGFVSILTGGLAIVPLYLILGWQPLRTERKPFHFRTYLWLVLVFFGIQFVTAYLNLPIEALVNFFGHSLETAAENAGGHAENIWLVLYGVLAAPLFEEILVRGFLYGSLRPYGRVFATLITAFLFGMMHTNVLQLLYAFFIGLFLAFVRETYGLFFAILLHFSNNLIVTLVANENAFSTYIDAGFTIIVVLGLIALGLSAIRYSRTIFQAVRAEQSLPWMLARFFTSVCVILLLISYVILTLLNLD